MPGSLTPLIMMSSQGLQEDTALAINSDLDVSSYTSQPIVVDYRNTINVLQGDFFEETENPFGLSSSIANSLIHALDDTTPFLTNVNPVVQGIDTDYFDTFLNKHLTNMFPSSGQYAQYLQIAMGQKEVANQYINSAINGAKLTEQTFTSTDALMSGNITAVSTDIQTWGQDLIDSGSLFDFRKLDNIGTPQAIVESLIAANMLTTIADELSIQGVDVFDLQKAINDDDDITISPVAQKRCYDAFTNVTGDQLTEILSVLQITTSGITALSDLLDLTKIFPNSFRTITTLNQGVLETIFINGVPQLYVKAFVTPATAYMPDDLAKTNYAFILSLGQIKGIINSTPQQIGVTASTIENNDGLALTGNLTEALPAATIEFFLEEMGGGTGPDDTFYLTDIVGTPAGIPHVENIATMNNNIIMFQTAGDLDDIAEILLVMRNVVNGVYDTVNDGEVDIPAGNPAEGLWPSRNAAINELIDELQTAASALITLYPTETTDATSAFNGSISSIKLELLQLWATEIKFRTTYVPAYQTNSASQDGLPADKKTVIAFAESLHSFGKKTDKRNIAEILEATATDTLGGNAIIAAMREGRNLDKLSESGIMSDNLIDDQPSIVEPGNIT